MCRVYFSAQHTFALSDNYAITTQLLAPVLVCHFNIVYVCICVLYRLHQSWLVSYGNWKKQLLIVLRRVKSYSDQQMDSKKWSRTGSSFLLFFIFCFYFARGWEILQCFCSFSSNFVQGYSVHNFGCCQQWQWHTCSKTMLQPNSVVTKWPMQVPKFISGTFSHWKKTPTAAFDW